MICHRHRAGGAHNVRQLSTVGDRSGGISRATSSPQSSTFSLPYKETQLTYQPPAGFTAAVSPWGMVPVAPTARLPVKVFCVAPLNWQWKKPCSSVFCGAFWQYGTARESDESRGCCTKIFAKEIISASLLRVLAKSIILSAASTARGNIERGGVNTATKKACKPCGAHGSLPATSDWIAVSEMVLHWSAPPAAFCSYATKLIINLQAMVGWSYACSNPLRCLKECLAESHYSNTHKHTHRGGPRLFNTTAVECHRKSFHRERSDGKRNKERLWIEHCETMGRI